MVYMDEKVVQYRQDKDPVAPLYDAYHGGIVFVRAQFMNTKQFTTCEEQLEILQSRGLIVDDNEIEVHDDHSCPNMSDIASCVNNEDVNKLSFNVYKCEDGYAPSLRLFILTNIANNEYINLEKMTQKEKEAFNTMNNWHFEELYDFDYIQIANQIMTKAGRKANTTRENNTCLT